MLKWVKNGQQRGGKNSQYSEKLYKTVQKRPKTIKNGKKFREKWSKAFKNGKQQSKTVTMVQIGKKKKSKTDNN